MTRFGADFNKKDLVCTAPGSFFIILSLLHIKDVNFGSLETLKGQSQDLFHLIIHLRAPV